MPEKTGEHADLVRDTLVHEGPGATVADHQMIGKMGRVTGTVAPGRLGEVMVEVRGGSEAFHAYAADNDETIPVGSRIVIVEYFPPRTVVVTRM
jgi:membrane protein implicated in regulation of membrane protease activity